MSNPRDQKDPFAKIIAHIIDAKQLTMEELHQRFVDDFRTSWGADHKSEQTMIRPELTERQAWGNMRRLIESADRMSFTTFTKILKLLRVELVDVQFDLLYEDDGVVKTVRSADLVIKNEQ